MMSNFGIHRNNIAFTSQKLGTVTIKKKDEKGKFKPFEANFTKLDPINDKEDRKAIKHIKENWKVDENDKLVLKMFDVKPKYEYYAVELPDKKKTVKEKLVSIAMLRVNEEEPEFDEPENILITNAITAPKYRGPGNNRKIKKGMDALLSKIAGEALSRDINYLELVTVSQTRKFYKKSIEKTIGKEFPTEEIWLDKNDLEKLKAKQN